MVLKVSNSENKRLYKPFRKTIMEYNMLEEGDRVAVGLSGGKDSSTLLYLLTLLKQQAPFHFDIVPITLTLGFDGMDLSPLQNYVESLGHELHIKETKISQIVFDIRQEKNPCSLCANLRRGILYDYAKSLGCNKVAYGHHLDDGIETFFMNLLFGGKLGVFRPVSYMSRLDITLIRPMIAIEEKFIIQFVNSREIPIIHNPCPADKNTKREEMKVLVKALSEKYPNVRQNFLHAVKNVREEDFWKVDK
ncbi:tRNA 2-thiocytidine biosynthesis TtcA family protein [Ureibacillus terrenus]|uniref:tRNA 2-thiocytidine(32) synthetase TtcA n=1 Tax=Ureibacillus terrenus TaxID=118246 RepID=A0A540UWH0_9BACL|nr:ATP-binding protein [Ureibacillus terrenus]MED3662691.1 ATP-binding protein [Ureibacillus terrenus]MED3765018.1 ATP-binding protein [Ureibacillus terrenus]TQE88850.1 tRNA 2-thiocytidine(32) synthetase TtcA [Ureibacillus terrenus]